CNPPRSRTQKASPENSSLLAAGHTAVRLPQACLEAACARFSGHPAAVADRCNGPCRPRPPICKSRPAPAPHSRSARSEASRVSSGASSSLVPASCHGHAIVTQKRIDIRLASAKRHKRFQCGAAAAGRQNFLAKTFADHRIEHPSFLEQAKGIRGKDFGPFVTVIAGR